MLGMWRSGNRFTLLPEGARFLPSMLEAVEGARHSILLELYLAESGHLSRVLIEALSAACQRGVNVLVLLDGFGSLGLEEADRQRMTEAGIALRFYNPIRWWRFESQPDAGSPQAAGRGWRGGLHWRFRGGR